MVEVRLNSGRVVGSAVTARPHGQVFSFLGIPYAAALDPSTRFRPPIPRAPWDGVHDGTRPGQAVPQAPMFGPLEPTFGRSHETGPDCLNLNVWTPDPGGAGLPVLVWFHGGGYEFGSGADPLYDGSAFARDGVVFVSANYRLGAEGFLHLGDDIVGSGNFGTLDQIAVLEWVRDNIARFGGDPERVTVAGQSAGAMAVCTLLAVPAAWGLFRSAISLSGGGLSGLDADEADLVGADLFSRLGLRKGDVDGIRETPHERLVAAQVDLKAEFLQTQDRDKWGALVDVVPKLPFQPTIGLDICPLRPVDAAKAGCVAQASLIVAHTKEECRFFLGFLPEIASAMTSEMVEPSFSRVFGQNCAEALNRYRHRRDGADPMEIIAALGTDREYRIGSIALAEEWSKSQRDVWMYRSSWKTPTFGGRVGAGHAIDLPFVFDRLDEPTSAQLVGTEAPQELADLMHGEWVSFVSTGAADQGQLPDWARYESTRRATMEFDAGRSGMIDDPEGDERELWATVPRRQIGL